MSEKTNSTKKATIISKLLKLWKLYQYISCNFAGAAKEKAPCVVFIDEIDSVGAKRTNSVLHPYANQTINQLLSEMDG